MKTLSDLYDNLLDEDTIRHTAHVALSNRKKTPALKRFITEPRYSQELSKLREGLMNETLPIQGMKYPKIIHEPNSNKDRLIYPPSNTEHIIHHLVCNQLESFFMKGMYDFCVASVPDRGGLYGKKYLEKWIKRYDDKPLWVLKMDIHHFFDSIDRRILYDKLSSHIKDERFNRLLTRILWYDSNDINVGIPIGFYTSQWFANYYLQDFDYFIKQKLKVPHYMRYMDDIVLIGNRKSVLKNAIPQIINYLNNIGLELNPNYQLFKFSYFDKYTTKEKGRPIDFMGYVFHRNRTCLRKHTLCRARRKANKVNKHSDLHWYECVQALSMIGRMKCLDTHQYFETWMKPKIKIKRLRMVVSEHDKYEYMKGREI